VFRALIELYHNKHQTIIFLNDIKHISLIIETAIVENKTEGNIFVM
jgi:hypothetical protein